MRWAGVDDAAAGDAVGVLRVVWEEGVEAGGEDILDFWVGWGWFAYPGC